MTLSVEGEILAYQIKEKKYSRMKWNYRK